MAGGPQRETVLAFLILVIIILTILAGEALARKFEAVPTAGGAIALPGGAALAPAGGAAPARPVTTVTCSNFGRRGDMGNQMFQVAAALAAAREANGRFVVPTAAASLPLFGLCGADAFEFEDVRPSVVLRETANYAPLGVLPDGRCYDVRGYRQSWRYFAGEGHAAILADEIRSLLRPREDIVAGTRAALRAAGVPADYIAVHIRRGDYLSWHSGVPGLEFFRWFSDCAIPYYRRSVAALRGILGPLPVVVCTDSPDWARQHLADIASGISLSPAAPIPPKLADFTVLYLARGVVISNSTYSWWAAYLAPGRPVVAPSPWWDSRGYVARAFCLDGDHLHAPGWALRDPETGDPAEPAPRPEATLGVLRALRGAAL